MTSSPPLLRLSGLTKAFGPVTAVAPLDLDVVAEDFCAILGPSGCGKSTLLRMIAGFIEPSRGGRLPSKERMSPGSAPKRGRPTWCSRATGSFPI